MFLLILSILFDIVTVIVTVCCLIALIRSVTDEEGVPIQLLLLTIFLLVAKIIAVQEGFLIAY